MPKLLTHAYAGLTKQVFRAITNALGWTPRLRVHKTLIPPPIEREAVAGLRFVPKAAAE